MNASESELEYLRRIAQAYKETAESRAEALRLAHAYSESIYRRTATALGADSLAAECIAKDPEQLVVAAQQRSAELGVSR